MDVESLFSSGDFDTEYPEKRADAAGSAKSVNSFIIALPEMFWMNWKWENMQLQPILPVYPMYLEQEKML